GPWRSLIQDLTRESIYPVAIDPEGDKAMRMNAQTARIEAGSVDCCQARLVGCGSRCKSQCGVTFGGWGILNQVLTYWPIRGRISPPLTPSLCPRTAREWVIPAACLRRLFLASRFLLGAAFSFSTKAKRGALVGRVERYD